MAGGLLRSALGRQVGVGWDGRLWVERDRDRAGSGGLDEGGKPGGGGLFKWAAGGPC